MATPGPLSPPPKFEESPPELSQPAIRAYMLLALAALGGIFFTQLEQVPAWAVFWFCWPGC